MALVLLLFLIASILTLGTALTSFSDGKIRRALKIAAVWLKCAAVYAGALVAAPFFQGDQPLRTGVPYCDDDVCMAVTGVSGQGDSLRLAIGMSSLANHGLRSAGGALFYLVDENHRRFFPKPEPGIAPIDSEMDPHSSFATSLAFDVPAKAGPLWLEASMDHIRYASFIIGIGDLTGRPRVRIRIR